MLAKKLARPVMKISEDAVEGLANRHTGYVIQWHVSTNSEEGSEELRKRQNVSSINLFGFLPHATPFAFLETSMKKTSHLPSQVCPNELVSLEVAASGLTGRGS